MHEVAQQVTPDARVAYVDYDPVVLCYARALLAGTPSVIAAEGDLRDPGAIIASPQPPSGTYIYAGAAKVR